MSQTKVIGLRCRECGALYPEESFCLTCPDCGGTMRVEMSIDHIGEALKDGYPAFDDRSFFCNGPAFCPSKILLAFSLYPWVRKKAHCLHRTALAKCMVPMNCILRLN